MPYLIQNPPLNFPSLPEAKTNRSNLAPKESIHQQLSWKRMGFTALGILTSLGATYLTTYSHFKPKPIDSATIFNFTPAKGIATILTFSSAFAICKIASKKTVPEKYQPKEQLEKNISDENLKELPIVTEINNHIPNEVPSNQESLSQSVDSKLQMQNTISMVPVEETFLNDYGVKLKPVPNLPFPFYLLPAGKPDSKIMWKKGEKRPFVIQAPQKGNTCWYYAMNRLRFRIGKQFPMEYKAQRQVEKQYSELRKKLSSSFFVNDHLENLKKICTTFLSSNSFKEISPNLISDNFLKMLKSETKESHYFNFFCEFQNQNLKLGDFIKKQKNIFYRSMINLLTNFLKKKGMEPEQLYQRFIEKTVCSTYNTHTTNTLNIPILEIINKNRFESLKIKKQYQLLRAFTDNMAIQDYDFHKAEWNPKQSIEKLQDNLTSHGPLIFFGPFGRSYYLNAPKVYSNKVIKEAIGRKIYGWDKGSAKLKHNDIHVIVVIGAQKESNDRGYVYFIDPNDPSDPKNPESQRIYVTSYKNFINLTKEISYFPLTSQNENESMDKWMNSYAFYWQPNDVNHQEIELENNISLLTKPEEILMSNLLQNGLSQT